MSRNRSLIRVYAFITALLFSSLACRAATQLIFPATPTPSPTATATATATLTPTPTATATPVFEAACPVLLADVIDVAVGEDQVLSRKSFAEEDDVYLVTYEVRGDEISRPHFESIPSDLEDEQNDRTTHEFIWNYFAAIVPPQERERVSEFSIFTDGRRNHLAAVGQTYYDPLEWTLYVDILDSGNYYDLTYTLIHEQGHLLTLNSEQVPPSQAVFDNPDDETIYESEVSACPQYFTGEGCSNPSSYINEFFSRFWTPLYAEWQEIDAELDEDTRYSLLEDFYKTYQDQFLTDYAPTSPAEDVAESWAFFVLAPKPEQTSIANEKILFFYEYPELVELRMQILNQVCVKFPR